MLGLGISLFSLGIGLRGHQYFAKHADWSETGNRCLIGLGALALIIAAAR